MKGCAKKFRLKKYVLKSFVILTNPCLSLILFVNFSLWNETTFCIHCSPVDGESGWIYIRLGISGSALPATIHRLLKKENFICIIGITSEFPVRRVRSPSNGSRASREYLQLPQCPQIYDKMSVKAYLLWNLYR